MLASQNVEKLDEVFATTAAAFLMQTDEPVYGNKTILDELAIRLDLHWIGEGSFVRRRIALVDGGFSYEFRKDIFAAAAYLGIDLVVFDSPNHWIQKYESEQEPLAEFVPLDMALDHNLPHRITIAIKNYPAPFDGITTFTDSFLCATAQAAELLSLPTGPIEAFEMTVNKTKMREMFPLPIVRDMAEGFVPGCNEIVKPSEGGGSRAVFLARNDQERLRAKEFIKGLELVPVVEQYLDGPEVDVNIALQDGKVLFAEVSDNLPTMAEGFPSKYGTNSWLETGDVFPSGLPDEELAKLCNTTSAYLLKLGFRSGVFHCEARVLCSKFGYSSSETPYPRLRKLNKHIISNPPEVAIIEINARAPGNVSNKASMYASGIDFYALQFLAACGDNARFTSLSQPFSRSIGWWGGGFIGAEIGGTFTPQIMFEELKVQAPELMEHVFDWTVYLKPGDQFSDPVITGKYLWVAWFIVHSRKSRKNLESISEKVRGLLSFEVLPKGT
ncbi:MAG: hypothetical protein M1829_002447 [Trizodia sp. TS-e1964]|nr:MAG: hypothetical protein M1829_002447 [Trizodia sp. TS-e1964]